MNAEEYIINRIQELEKDVKTTERFLLSANSKVNILTKGNTKLLGLLDFLFDNLKITYDNRTGLLQVGSDNLLVTNADLEEYLKARNEEVSPWKETALRENQYRSWGHNTLEKDPTMDIVNGIKEVEDE